MKKEVYLEMLNEHFTKLNQVRLINTQLLNSNANENIKALCEHSKSILDSELQRLSQIIIALQRE